jgi:hypothetical protein
LYNSCRDRHCPTCQTLAKEAWLADRRAELLPVEYFHTVFTLPHALNPLIDANRAVLLGELFAAVNWVLQRFAADPQWRLDGQLGFLAALHTWTQKLQEHFHLHCLIPGGVWQSARQRWQPCRRRFLFGKQALCDAFRNRYLARLALLRRHGQLAFTGGAALLADPARWDGWLRVLAAQRWIARPQPTAAGPEQALDYLGRYVHRVALGDHRLRSLAQDQVRFTFRDRADGNRLKILELPAAEFIRRFLYHILPPGFQKIRYYGWLAAPHKQATLAAIRQDLAVKAPPPMPAEEPAARIQRLTGIDVRRCPVCGQSALVYVGLLAPAFPTGPPCM